MKRPDVCFSSSPKSPERGKESTVLRHRHPKPGRSRRSGAAPRPGPGDAGAGGKSVPGAEFTLEPGRRLPPPKMPGRASFLPRVPGRASEGAAGRAGRGSPLLSQGGKRPAWSLFFPLTPQFGPAAAADLWQDFCSGREGKKAIDFNRISPQTLLVCCCYASIWRSLFINERVRSVAKTLRARICVIKLRAGWSDLAGDGGGGRWASGTVTCPPAFPFATLSPQDSSPVRWRCGPGAAAVPPPAPCSLPAVLLNAMQAGLPVHQVPREEWR